MRRVLSKFIGHRTSGGWSALPLRVVGASVRGAASLRCVADVSNRLARCFVDGDNRESEKDLALIELQAATTEELHQYCEFVGAVTSPDSKKMKRAALVEAACAKGMAIATDVERERTRDETCAMVSNAAAGSAATTSDSGNSVGALVNVADSFANFLRPLPVLLISFYGPEKEHVALFYPEDTRTSKTTVLFQDFQRSDSWGVLEELVKQLNVSAGILLSLQSGDTKRCKALEGVLRGAGFPCIAGTSLLDLIQSVLPQSHVLTDCSSLEIIAAQFGSQLHTTDLHSGNEPATAETFAVCWNLLSAAAQRRGLVGCASDVANSLIFPMGEVFVVSLVMRNNVLASSMYSLVSGKKTSTRGRLEDVLADFIKITLSGPIILIPTSRTDKNSLFACAAALRRIGRRATIVFPKEISPSFARGLSQDSESMAWGMLKMESWEVADLLFEAKRAAGDFRRKRMIQGNVNEAHPEDRGDSGEVPLPSRVRDWLAKIFSPDRMAVEAATVHEFHKFIVMACETTKRTVYRREANPTVDENFIVYASFVDYAGALVLASRSYDCRSSFAMPKLDDYDVLVLHNAKDVLLLCWNDPELKKFFARGGKVWCTLLAEYLLTAQRRCGSDIDIASVAITYPVLPGQSSSLPAMQIDAQQDPLSVNLGVARSIGAAKLSGLVRIFDGQLQRAAAQCQLLSLKHRMDGMLAMAMIEHNGIYVDAVAGYNETQDARNRLAGIQSLLAQLAPRELPVDFRSSVNWMSSSHLEAIFFGGTMSFGPSRPPESAKTIAMACVDLAYNAGALQELTNDPSLLTFAQDKGITVPRRNRDLVEAVAAHLHRGPSAATRYRLVVFDLESTGRNADVDRIVEICLYDPVEGKTLSTLVNPMIPIPFEVISIHGITSNMVSSAPTFEALAPQLIRFLRLGPKNDSGTESSSAATGVKGSASDEVVILISHNCAQLDEPILRRQLEESGVAFDASRLVFCDTIPLFKSLRSKLRGRGKNALSSLKMSDLVVAFGVQEDGAAHRAEKDTRDLWGCLVRAFDQKDNSPETQRNALLKAMGLNIASGIGSSCLAVQASEMRRAEVRLPGLIQKIFPQDANMLLPEFRRNGVSVQVLSAFKNAGCKLASVLLMKHKAIATSGSFLDITPDGQLAMRHRDGCVRQNINVAACATGRTISSNPSCQNIPKDDKATLRRAFTSRFGDDGVVVEIDYTQLEIAVQAVLCGDKNMLADLAKGVDFHLLRVVSLGDCATYTEALERYKNGDQRIISMRRKAKVFGFGRMYGGGIKLLSHETGLPQEKVSRIVAEEDKRYPAVPKFHELVRLTAVRKDNPGLPTHYVFELPTGCRVAFTPLDALNNMPPLKNYPIQAFAAEIVQIMAGRVFRKFCETDSYGGKAFITNFVHDSIWLDCHKSAVDKAVKDAESILQDVRPFFERTFPGVDIGVDFGVKSSVGRDMQYMVHFHKFVANPTLIEVVEL